MRDLHSRMLGAVLSGDGLQGVVDLASEEAGGPVAIVLPARGLQASAPEGIDLNGAAVEAEAAIVAGDAELGQVLVLGPTNGIPEIDRDEIARTAALVALTEIAVSDARDEVTHELRATLIEELRSGALDGAEVARRAARLGCELPHGALVLVAEIRSRKPRAAAALIESEWRGALAELLDERLYAILPGAAPGTGSERPDEMALTAARKLTAQLHSHGPAAISSYYRDPAELHQAVREAELVLALVRRDPRLAEQIEAGSGDGVYRLLLRALVSDPAEVRAFYEETVAAIVAYDRQYRSELLATLEAYLAQDCNMNATARTIYAHRHTVAYRLERVRELTGLDPGSSTDRERIGLGIKAYRILAPALPK